MNYNFYPYSSHTGHPFIEKKIEERISLLAKSLLSVMNLSTSIYMTTDILVYIHKSPPALKEPMFYCDLLSRPTYCKGKQREQSALLTWQVRFCGREWFSRASVVSHITAESQCALNDSMLIRGLMNSRSDGISSGKLILHIYQCWIFEWTGIKLWGLAVWLFTSTHCF